MRIGDFYFAGIRDVNSRGSIRHVAVVLAELFDQQRRESRQHREHGE